MKTWVLAGLLAACLGTGTAMANGPQPHVAEGMVKVKRKRSGKIKSVEIGGVKLVTFVVQPNSDGRKANEALAELNLERIAQWDGKIVKVEGLTGFSAGVVRGGRIMPSRPLTSQIQVLSIKTPIEIDPAVPLTFEDGRVVHPELGSLTPAGNSATALQGITASSINVRGFVFTDSQEVFVEGAKPSGPAPVADAPAKGAPAGSKRTKTVGLTGVLEKQ